MYDIVTEPIVPFKGMAVEEQEEGKTTILS